MIKGSLFIKRNFNDLYYEIIESINLLQIIQQIHLKYLKQQIKRWLYNISSILKNGTVEFMRIESKKTAQSNKK